jgi:hypothetical protein
LVRFADFTLLFQCQQTFSAGNFVILSYSSLNVTDLVSGFTVNRTSLETILVVALVDCVEVPLPPSVRVPPFSLGEPFGSSCVVAML